MITSDTDVMRLIKTLVRRALPYGPVGWTDAPLVISSRELVDCDLGYDLEVTTAVSFESRLDSVTLHLVPHRRVTGAASDTGDAVD